MFDFGKVFEEEGTLGKGITVGKVQVALQTRSDRSILKNLERHAAYADRSNNERALAKMANDVLLDLLRKSDEWIAASSSSEWFSGKDASKAEGKYNRLVNAEAAKFEKVRTTGNGLVFFSSHRQ